MTKDRSKKGFGTNGTNNMKLRTLKSRKNGKSPVHDGIRPEILKYGGPSREDFKDAQTVSKYIHKKDGISDRGNYRGIPPLVRP